MPGPSRSKGCRTCRRRKVKCDEQKPHCERCQKGGFVCEGYRSAIIWIDQTEKMSTSANSDKGGPMQSRKGSSGGGNSRSNGLMAVTRSPSPFSIDAYIIFTAQQLFGVHAPAEGPEHDHKRWISSITQENPNQVAYTALKCLATTYFGRMQRRPDVMRKGTALYVKALQQLRRSLRDVTTAYDSRNLAATMALVHYEVISYTDKYGWIKHAGGTGRLMEMRGPERHQDEPEHTYFLLTRLRITTQAIMSRQAVFLERPEWQTIPWAKHPETKTPTDDLIDILTHVPGILVEFDRLNKLAGVLEGEGGLWHLSRRPQGPDQDGWDRLRGRLITLMQRLEQWRQLWEARQTTKTLRVEKRAPDPATSLTWDPDLQYPAKVTHFATFTAGYEVAVYILTLTMLGSMAAFLRDPQDIYRQVKSATSSKNEVSNPVLTPVLSSWSRVDTPDQLLDEQQQHTTDKLNLMPPYGLPHIGILDQATELLDFLLLEQHRGKGAFTAMVLLRICFLGFVGFRDEAKVMWTVRTLRRLADATCFDLSRHLDGYTILGGEMKVGSLRQREFVDRIRMKSTTAGGGGGGGGGDGAGGNGSENKSGSGG